MVKKVVGALVALALGVVAFQILLPFFRPPPTDRAELERMTLYAEGVHNVATASFSSTRRFSTGDCLEGYPAGSELAPDASLRALITSCTVGRDSNDRPVVRLRHKDGAEVSVP